MNKIDKIFKDNEALKDIIKEIYRLWNLRDSDDDLDFIITRTYQTIMEMDKDEENN